MKTKRQPTTKTMLLLMAVIAVQCAAMSWIGQLLRIEGERQWIGTLATFSGGIIFWSMLPLAIALFLRSARRAAMIGCGFGVTAIVSYFYCSEYVYDMCRGLGIENIWGYGVMAAMFGPFQCLAAVTKWWGMYPVELSMLPQIAVNAVWLVIYTTTCFLVAKSCRLREQPIVEGAPAP